MNNVSTAFGPDGLGILAVRGVPSFEEKRQSLLPLAEKLPTLPDLDSCVDEASMYSIGWSHGKESLASGKRDDSKGSYYINPFDDASNIWPSSLPELKTAVLEMADILQSTGCLVAKVCDEYCRRQLGTRTSIETALTTSKNAKGRLLHYFPATESSNGGGSWCAWHNDHSCLTGLVPGMYMQEGETVPNPDPNSGLFIQSRSSKEPVRASIPPDCCAFQIGESSQILSGGRLRATPHAVSGSAIAKVSRESFALFLQPNEDFVLNLPERTSLDDLGVALRSDIASIQSRWKAGQTFGEFHWATIQKFVVKD